MSHHGPSAPVHAPAPLLPGLSQVGNNLDLLLSTYQHLNKQHINLSLKPPEKAFGHLALWITLFFLGLGSLPIQFYLMSTVSIEIGFIGLALATASTMGLSTHLSAHFNDPRYNLFKNLRNFMFNHKFLTLCAGAGIIMLNPLTAILGLSIGVVADVMLYGILNEIERQTSLFFEWVKRTITVQNAENLLRYCYRHPLNMLSMLSGSVAGLAAFTHYFPQIFPKMFEFAFDSFKALQNTVGQYTSSLPRGIVPYSIITAVAALALTIALPLSLLLFPALAVGAGGWLGLKLWEKSYAIGSFVCQKIYRAIKRTPQAQAPLINPELPAAREAIPAVEEAHDLAAAPAEAPAPAIRIKRGRAPVGASAARRYPLRERAKANPEVENQEPIARRTRHKKN